MTCESLLLLHTYDIYDTYLLNKIFDTHNTIRFHLISQKPNPLFSLKQLFLTLSMTGLTGLWI